MDQEPKPDTIEQLTARLARLEEEQERDAALLASKKSFADGSDIGPTQTAQMPANEPLPQSQSTPPLPKAEKAPKKSEKAEKETLPKNPEEEIQGFISEFDLEPLLPREFENLYIEQKLKVIRDLKRRIVDIVKSDAQTQYSEDLKKKTIANVAPTGSKLSSLLGTIKDMGKNLGIAIKTSVKKESDLRNAENKVFEELTTSNEGRRLIAEDLEILVRKASNQRIGHWGHGELEDRKKSSETKPYVFYVGEDSIEATNLNKQAHIFGQMPYEWGQEKSGKHKKDYDKAKARYEKARNEVLKIKESKETRENEGGAMLEILETDIAIKMEQLLNTHPEFENVLNDFSKSKEGIAWGRTAKKFFTSTSFNKENVAIGIGGATLRFGAKIGLGLTSFMASGMFVATPVIGALTGYWRGRVRGGKTLEERKKGARHGQKDINKEKAKMVDVTSLINGLEKMTNQAENATNSEKKAKLLGKLAVVIEYTEDQIEKGQVNFGDTKTTLVNQFNLINNLNRALVLEKMNAEKINLELIERINSLIEIQGKELNKKISEKQKAFITRQAKKGAIYGAGFATAGYVLRYVGEHMGWWGEHGTGITKPDIHVSPEEMARLEKLANLKKIFPKITDYQEINENGQKVLIEKFNTGKMAKIFPNGHVEWYDKAGKLYAEEIIEKDEADILGIKIPEQAQTTPPQVEPEPTPTPETSAVEPETPPAQTPAPAPTTPEPNLPKIENSLLNVKVNLSEKGFGQTILDAKEQLKLKYGDPDKMPAGVKKFIETPYTKQVEEYGFYNSTTGESGMGMKGEELSLEVDKDGNVKLSLVHSNNETELVDTEGHKFAGKMFKPENPTQETLEVDSSPEEPVPHHQDVSQEELVSQSTQETTPAEADTTLKPTTAEEARQAVLEKMNAPRTKIPAPPAIPIEDLSQNNNAPAFFETNRYLNEYGQSTFSKNPFHLTGEKLTQTYKVYQQNLSEVFRHTEDKVGTWKEWRGIKASTSLKKENFDENNPLIVYLHKLQNVTKLKPQGGFIRRAETIDEYIGRALQKATQLERLDELRLAK